MDGHSCGACGDSFTDLVTFLIHKLKHVEGGRGSSCLLCGLAFSRQISLREHLYRKHSIPGVRSSSGHRPGDNTRHAQPPSDGLSQTCATDASTAESETGKIKPILASTQLSAGRDGAKRVCQKEPAIVSLENGCIEGYPSGGDMDFVREERAGEGDTQVTNTRERDMQVSTQEPSFAACVPKCPAGSDSETDQGGTTHVLVINKNVDDSVSKSALPECPVPALASFGTNQQTVGATDSAVPNTVENGVMNGQQAASVAGLCDITGHPESFGSQHILSECIGTGGIKCSPVSALASNTATHHLTGSTAQNQQVEANMDSAVSSSLSGGVDVGSKFSSTCLNTLPNKGNPVIHTPEDSMSASPSVSKDNSDSDFLFVLCPRTVRGNSFSYGKMTFKCFHCDYKTTWRNCLVKHMQDKHADMLAIHHCISIQTTHTTDQQQVMKMSEYMAKCSQQRKLTENKRIRSVETQDLPGSFPCNKCGKTFCRLRYLRAHMRTHYTDKKHLCDECGKAFKAKSYLIQHRRTHLLRSYSCHQCDFTSSINSLIHVHRQLHSEGSVLCDICGAAYTDGATLKKHKMVHDPARPYPCTFPGCTWRFLTEVKCRAHHRAHTTPGRFNCRVCGYVFRHKHHLQRHLMKIHGMDKTSVYRMTASARQHRQTEDQAAVESEAKELVEVVHEQPIQETVNLIMNSDMSSEQLQTMLESGQLVIATDSTDSTINYEVTDITMGVDCQTLIESGETAPHGQTILIPHSECSQIILHQEPGVITTGVET